MAIKDKKEKFYIFPWAMEDGGAPTKKEIQDNIKEIFMEDEDYPVPYYEVVITRKFEASKNNSIVFKEIKE